MTIWNKAVDKWGDWQAAQHIAKKYDDDGYLRKYAAFFIAGFFKWNL